MSESIATGPADPPPPPLGQSHRLDAWLDRAGLRRVAVGLFLLAVVVYLGSNPARADVFDHFVWQADAFLQGRSEIAYPVSEGPYRNDHFQDVMPVAEGRGSIPFPPLPAIVLLPFVAVWGLGTNGAVVAAVLGAVNVALCWLMLRQVTSRPSAAFLGTVFYGFGSVAWYAAMLGTTWFLAHVVASTCLFVAISVALRADGRPRALGRQMAAGLALGAAAAARLTTIFGAPFFVFVGGGSRVRRAAAAVLGAGVPLLLLLGYNLATTGEVFHPAYDYLYQVEYRPRPELVHPAWAAEDPRYIPQNLGIMLAQPPLTPLTNDPRCALEEPGLHSLLDRACPVLRPDPLGMSILLTSPAYLLAIPGLLDRRRRLVTGAALAVLAIAIADLMHFSQGWVQFGYRFSNDFAPFAVILVTLGIARLGVGWVTGGLVAASVAVNAWGVYWGVALGW